jgi:hypothetical protein
MTYLILCPLIVLLLYYGCRKFKNPPLLYCLLLIVTFLPTIPFFYFYVYYTSTVVKNIALLLFASVAIASLIQKGIVQKMLVLLFIVSLFPFGKSHYEGGDYSDKVVTETIEFDNYVFFLEGSKSVDTYYYHWRGKKYMIGNMIYKWLGVTDSSLHKNPCIRTLFVEYTNNHEKGISHPEKVIIYDTCTNKIISASNPAVIQ